MYNVCTRASPLSQLVKEESVLVFNKPAFHDTTLSSRIGFVGEWWSDGRRKEAPVPIFRGRKIPKGILPPKKTMGTPRVC